MKKILIVEDDKFLANAYLLKLTKSGFEAKVASDGEEALKTLNNFIPDLIILDLIMPKKDGFTFLEEIKQNAAWRSIPVIISSNLGQEEDVEKGLKLGADDYIIKSELSIRDLVAKVNSYLNNPKKPTS